MRWYFTSETPLSQLSGLSLGKCWERASGG